MLHIMNSAMMPQDGEYTMRRIDAAEAKEMFVLHNKPGRTTPGRPEWKSYIGYQQTAAILSALVGVKIPVSREQTIFENGDEALVIKLRYRVNPREKNGGVHGQTLADYEFCFVTYRKV